jgi:TldD protein
MKQIRDAGAMRDFHLERARTKLSSRFSVGSIAVDRGVRIKGRWVNQRIDSLTVERISGHSIGVHGEGGLIHASSTDPTDDLVGRISDSENTDFSEVAVIEQAFSAPQLVPLSNWLRVADAAARSASPSVVQVVIDFEVTDRHLWFGQLTGTVGDDSRSLTYMILRVIASDGSSLSTGFFTPATRGGIDLLDAETCGTEAARRSLGGLGARSAPIGELPVVVSGGRGIVMLHEACCHPLEGDEVLRGSTYADQIGKPVAASGVTIVDDPLLENAVGSYSFDDEGTPARSTVVIRDGQLTGFLTDLDTAARMGCVSSGNGRSPSALHAPLPRMTNTCLLPGPHTPEELLSATPLGLYAEHVGGGEVVEATGRFTFRVTNAFMIRDGQLAEPVLETTVSGHGGQVLRDTDAENSVKRYLLEWSGHRSV